MTPVVLIAEELAPAAIDVLAHDFEVRHVDGADRDALLPALAGVDAVLVRSATRIDAEALADAHRLRSSRAPGWASTTSRSQPRPTGASWWSTRRRRTSSRRPSTRSH